MIQTASAGAACNCRAMPGSAMLAMAPSSTTSTPAPRIAAMAA
jgi:hypothetical protein